MWQTLYNTFYKRTTVYVPFLLVGAYYSNQIIDSGVEAFWNSRNRGKSFQDMVAAVQEAGVGAEE